MITCRDCKSVNDQNSKFCHKCGRNFVPDARSSKIKYIPLAFIAAVAGLWGWSIVSYQRLSPAQKERLSKRQEANVDRSADALADCEQAVSLRLKAPSTASFSHASRDRITGSGDGPYQVIGWVDAQNSFGAMLRNYYECSTERRAGTWTTRVTLTQR